MVTMVNDAFIRAAMREAERGKKRLIRAYMRTGMSAREAIKVYHRIVEIRTARLKQENPDLFD